MRRRGRPAIGWRMHFDTIIFDLDGTLVDTAADLTASLNHALVLLGRSAIDPATVRHMVGRGARVLLQRGLAATGGEDEELLERGLTVFLDHYAGNIAVHSRPFDGVEDTLDALERQGLRLAVCTNKPEGLARQLLGSLGWEQRFGALLGGDSRPWRKPDPRHLFETLREAGGARPIFVGDSKTDADTALAADVPLVLVSFGYSTEPVETLGATRLIDRFTDLGGAVADIQASFKGRSALGAA